MTEASEALRLIFERIRDDAVQALKLLDRSREKRSLAWKCQNVVTSNISREQFQPRSPRHAQDAAVKYLSRSKTKPVRQPVLLTAVFIGSCKTLHRSLRRFILRWTSRV
jgi:hypothetical protein